MDWKESWKIKGSATINEAAMLICDENPSILKDKPDAYRSVEGFYPVQEALIEYLDNEDKRETIAMGESLRGWVSPDPSLYSVSYGHIKEWLLTTNSRPEFFFSKKEIGSIPPYLDPMHKNYSPKLAAAIEVWSALASDPGLLKRKSVQNAAREWLIKHADKYEFIKGEKKWNDAAIEQIFKIINWTKGGPPSSA